MLFKFRVVLDLEVVCHINMTIELVVFDAILAVERKELSIEFYGC